jgi:RNA polymerase sigma-70 factor (ECF subfamily)
MRIVQKFDRQPQPILAKPFGAGYDFFAAVVLDTGVFGHWKGAFMDSADEVRQQALLEQAVSGDQQAWWELLNSLKPYVAKVVLDERSDRVPGWVGNSDVVESVLVVAGGHGVDAKDDQPEKNNHAFRGRTLAELKAWLATTAKFKLWAEARKQREVVRLDDGQVEVTVISPSPSGEIRKRELHDVMAQALQRLCDDDRAVLMWRHSEGLSHREIGERLSIGEDAAGMRYLRALRRLKDLRKEFFDSDSDSVSNPSF